MEMLNQVLYFFIYSFVGWTMESIYMSFRENRFVNQGFLYGPFCPIYGFGALGIIQLFQWISLLPLGNVSFLLVGVFSSIMVATGLEYMAGTILEKIFNVKWWDYSEESHNLNGRICIKYSLLWGGLAFLLIMLIQPMLEPLVEKTPDSYRQLLSILLILIMGVDTTVSTTDLIDLRKVLKAYEALSLEYYHQKVLKYRRFFFTFPFLFSINKDLRNYDSRRILNEKIKKFKIQLKKNHFS